ncbi:hypothetical protein NFI96_025467, partial [Prochilodus magdalenae]
TTGTYSCLLYFIQLHKIYHKYETFKRAHIHGFYRGSIVVTTDLIFNTTAPGDEEIITTLYDSWTLRNTTLNLKNNSLRILRSAATTALPITSTSSETPTPTTTSTETPQTSTSGSPSELLELRLWSFHNSFNNHSSLNQYCYPRDLYIGINIRYVTTTTTTASSPETSTATTIPTTTTTSTSTQTASTSVTSSTESTTTATGSTSTSSAAPTTVTPTAPASTPSPRK